MADRHLDVTPIEADDVQRLDNVLADTPTPPVTRKALLGRAAAGAAAAGTLGAFGPASSALARNAAGPGKFYDFKKPPANALAHLSANKPA
jgi:hypothetical protein